MINNDNRELAKFYLEIAGIGSRNPQGKTLESTSKKIFEFGIRIASYFNEHGNLNNLKGLDKKAKEILEEILTIGYQQTRDHYESRMELKSWPPPMSKGRWDIEQQRAERVHPYINDLIGGGKIESQPSME